MSKKDYAMRMALDWYDSGNENPDDFANMIKQVIALAQQQAQGCDYCNHPQYAGIKCKNCGREQPAQQQEPVVWMYVNKSTHETKFQKHMRGFVDHGLWAEVPLYGEPLANHELRCVCGAVWCGDEMVHLPDKRPPASKPWWGLTDEEALFLIENELLGRGELIDAIEAKLKEKNGF